MASLFDTGALERLRRRERQAEGMAVRFYPPLICVHVVGEHLYGLAWAEVSAAAFLENQEFLGSFETLAPTSDTAAIYARLRAEARRDGRHFPDADFWIAAHAIEEGLPLVSTDHHFKAFPEVDLHLLD